MELGNTAASQRTRTNLCCIIGLACMFGGIWLGDRQVVDYCGIENATVIMRFSTLAIYAAFFAMAYWTVKVRRRKPRNLFLVLSVVGILSFIGGAVIILFVLPVFPSDGSAAQVLGTAAIVLTKVIGAPVSIALVCSFSLLERTTLMGASASGMLGAFLIYSLFLQVDEVRALSASVLMLCSIALLSVSLVCCLIVSAGHLGFATRHAVAAPAALSVPGVVKRPLKKVLTPGFILMVVFSAMMLGFLRSGFSSYDVHSDPASFFALVALLAVALFWHGLRMEHVFYSALFFSVVGILLAPSLELVIPGLSFYICGIGTALFEVLTWALVVWGTRNCIDAFVAASGSRLAAVIGHLLGTVVVGLGMLVSTTSEDALHTGALIIVFAYIVLLVVLLKFPKLQAPFLMSVDTVDAAAAMPPAQDADDVDQQANDNEASQDERFWTNPCDTIAETYHLTAREREILELMARGRDMPYMEGSLYISRNTLKMHIRHIYTKLDIHGRQGIIDMVEQIRQ